MKNNNLLYSLAFAFVSSSFIMASCEGELIGPEKANTPTNNFEQFWKTFDEHYGMFEVKNIDWKVIHDQFKPKINDQMTDEELYIVLSDMIVSLNDNHLNLYPTNGDLPVFPGGVLSYRNGQLKILKVQEDYDIEVAKTYTKGYEQVTDNIGYGKLPDNLIYLNVKGTDGLKDVEKEMEKVMANIASARGVIIDVRGFYGGYDPVSQYLAGCFATSRQLYMTTKKRNGPAHSDFTEPAAWYVEPKTSIPFAKQVIVLSSRFTQSAGETFELALRQFEHVKAVGDTTAGSFSDNPNFEMYNGWMFSVSVGDYRAPSEISYEGFGMPPDVFAKTTKEDLLAGKDVTLEKAIEIILK
ncbi:MAG: S41 family peptidase [Cyclobacteriaceae bacterium]|jgi:carboxyl-terminal processing protease|nr:S41 family peptidase [Cyclobacteriaceae bacterium]